MGTLIETDVTVADTGEILTPVVQALGWYDYGGTAAASLRNLAVPANPAAAVGSPAYAPTYATFGASSSIDSKIFSTDDMTLFAVVKTSSAEQNCRFFSDFDNSITADQKGFAFRYSNTTLSLLHADGDNTPITLTLATTGRTAWRTAACRIGIAPGELTLFDLTAGTKSTSAPANLKRSALPIRLGAAPLTSTNGDSDFAYQAIYPGRLTDAQIAEVATFIRSEFAIKMAAAGVSPVPVI